MKLRSESVENLFLGLTSYRDTFRSVSWIIKGDVRTENSVASKLAVAGFMKFPS